jgi:Domain of unknown function (DUF4157)
MSNDIQAQAFTHGSDVYFNEGKYSPGSTDGQRLLAHELVHTVQQGGGKSRDSVQRYSMEEFKNDVSESANSVYDLYENIGDSVENISTSISRGAIESGQSAVSTGRRALNNVINSTSTSLSLLSTEAGQIANRLISTFGGTLSLATSGISIIIPRICPINSLVQTITLPSYSPTIMMPVLALPLAPGLSLTGRLGLAVRITPELQLQLGPICLEHVIVVINPLTGSFHVNGSLSITHATAFSGQMRGGVRGEVNLDANPPGFPFGHVLLPGLSIEAGLAGLVRGAASDRVTVGGSFTYGAGTIRSMNSLSLDLGLAADLFAGAYGELGYLGRNLCSIYFDLERWHGELATSLNLAYYLSAGIFSPPSFAHSIDVTPIPFESIPFNLSREGFKNNCPIEAPALVSCNPVNNMMEAELLHTWASAIMLYTGARFGPATAGLWRSYLNKSGNSPRPTQSFTSGEIPDGFTRHHKSIEAEREILGEVEKSLSGPMSHLIPELGTTINLPLTNIVSANTLSERINKEEDTMGLNYDMASNSIPGNIAGGIGKKKHGGGPPGNSAWDDDHRGVIGQVVLLRNSPTSLLIMPKLTFFVHDTVDFCPGNLGSPFAHVMTLAFSVLEATEGKFGPIYAADVPFNVWYPGIGSIMTFIIPTIPSSVNAPKKNQDNQKVQPKLIIGSQDSIYEKQADAIADKVVQRMAAPAPTPAADQEEKLQRKEEEVTQTDEQVQMKPIFDSATPPDDNTLQRKCADCEKEESDKVQRKESGGESAASPDISSRLSASKGGGSPLPDNTRTQMESAMGADFSGVRVHTGSEAAGMSNDIQAQAFTHGSDVYFNEGKYSPGSSDGQRLLAHELVHTVQQGGGIRRTGISPVDEVKFEIASYILPAIKILGPYSDEAVAKTLYGDPLIKLTHFKEDYSLVEVDINKLLSKWRSMFFIPESEEKLTDLDLVELGLISSGTLLKNLGLSVENLRGIYNNGIEAILDKRNKMLLEMLPKDQAKKLITDLGRTLDKDEMAKMIGKVLPEQSATQIAKELSGMRHDLALEVRKISGTLLEKSAELYDLVRGNRVRPAFESLIKKRTAAQIILSATRSDKLMNRLPKGLKIGGGAMWVITGAVSLYIILNAPKEKRAEVAKEEVKGIIGGAVGASVAETICIGLGVLTEGIGLIICGLIGGALGFSIAKNPESIMAMLGIGTQFNEGWEGKVYKLVGAIEEIDLFVISIPLREIKESDHVLVITTGRIQDGKISGKGHYKSIEVLAMNQPAIKQFEGKETIFVPQFLLSNAKPEDFKVA